MKPVDGGSYLFSFFTNHPVSRWVIVFITVKVCFRQGTRGRPAHVNATIKESSMSSYSNEDNVSVKQAEVYPLTIPPFMK